MTDDSTSDAAADGGDFEIRAFRAGDEQRLLDLHNAVFPDAEKGVAARGPDHWAWKFRDNPVGTPHIVVADAGDAGIVGTFSALPAYVWIEGERKITAQGVDLVVLPEWRRRPARPGMFVHLSRYYLDHFCGRDDGKTLFTYGWPIPNWRIGQKYLEYQMVCNWDVTFRELAAPGYQPPDAPGDLEVRETERFGPDLDPIFEGLKHEMPILLDRSARTLNWRFADCPDRDYTLYECREKNTGTLRGACVFRSADFVIPHAGLIMEWVCPRDDMDATVAMIAALEARARGDGCPALASVWSAQDPRFLHLQRMGYLVRGTSYFLVVQTFKHDVPYLRENWFYTMGDCDMV